MLYVLVLVLLFVPRLALAHPGHPGGDAAHLNGGGVVVLVGVTVGLAVHAWNTWGKQWDKARDERTDEDTVSDADATAGEVRS